VASKQYREVFVDALLKEMEARSGYLNGEEVNTVYFGGGTPSMLSVEELNRIIRSLKKYFLLSPDLEITLEANPDDLTDDKVKALKEDTPVNRFSIGVQSFHDDDLLYLDRIHNGKDAINALERVLKAGFKNLTIDLIYGIPGLTQKKWKKNLDLFFSYDIPHLSSYSLTVEPKTALAVQIKKRKKIEPDEELAIKHFELLTAETSRHGYVHYEISNFAKKGFYSKHNSIYWLGGHYLGLGPSAHSFNGVSRQWNVASVKKYVESDKVEKIIDEKEILTIEQRFNEYVMTSLRTVWGCDMEHVRNVFGGTYVDHFVKEIKKYLDQGFVKKNGSRYLLTEKGKLFADGIASDLFYDL
jgi:oxygen-independent coproporphyrinogen-3 oxidase